MLLVAMAVFICLWSFLLPMAMFEGKISKRRIIATNLYIKVVVIGLCIYYEILVISSKSIKEANLGGMICGNVKVKKVTPKQSVIEAETKSGIKELVINRSEMGHSYDDFAEWDITDREYYDLEKLVDNVIDRMRDSSSLNITWEA